MASERGILPAAAGHCRQAAAAGGRAAGSGGGAVCCFAAHSQLPLNLKTSQPRVSSSPASRSISHGLRSAATCRPR